MNRDYINWLETLPCNRKPQKVNVWMSEWAPLLKRLICLLTRIGKIARISATPEA